MGGAMHLSELLSLPVVDHDHERVGSVIDVRLTVSGDPAHDPGAPHLAGLLVSPRTTSSYLGYERSDSRRPRPLAALLAWRHRGTFLGVAGHRSAGSGGGGTAPRLPTASRPFDHVGDQWSGAATLNLLPKLG